MPWPTLCVLIEPFYPKPGNGRPPVGVERMLCIYFLQQWLSATLAGVAWTAWISLLRLSTPKCIRPRKATRGISA